MTKPRPPAKDRLASYRAFASGAAPIDHVFADADGQHLMVKTMDGEDEAIAIIPHACPADNREIFLHCAEIITDLITMIDKTGAQLVACRVERERLETRKRNKAADGAMDYAAECAIKCADEPFQRFMAERHDLRLPTDAQKTATRVRFLLAIETRADLNTNPAAATRWRDLVRAYEAWRRH
ncbi:MAG: hypothetical protein ABGW90_11270 [Martelella sp.]